MQDLSQFVDLIRQKYFTHLYGSTDGLALLWSGGYLSVLYAYLY